MDEPTGIALSTFDRARDLLDLTANDRASDVVKAFISAFPVLGPVTVFALEQRSGTQAKRIIRYLEILDEYVVQARVDLAKLREEWDRRPEAAELLSRGMAAAGSATSQERLRRLAAVVAHGLRSDEVAAMNEARRLRVLESVDDGEFAVLVVVERERRVTLRYDDGYQWVEDGTITFVSTGETADPPELPPELATWSIPDLSTALNRLAGLGLIEGNISQFNKATGAIRSFVATPAGQELLRICRDAGTAG